MGYSTSGQITNYQPDNDENTLYIQSSYIWSLQDLLDQIKKHFGDISFDDLTITSENIHTRCITYDMHDSSDWDEFLIIKKK